jgi:hypothetical protein
LILIGSVVCINKRLKCEKLIAEFEVSYEMECNFARKITEGLLRDYSAL